MSYDGKIRDAELIIVEKKFWENNEDRDFCYCVFRTSSRLWRFNRAEVPKESG
jgi:hypothetical protein